VGGQNTLRPPTSKSGGGDLSPCPPYDRRPCPAPWYCVHTGWTKKWHLFDILVSYLVRCIIFTILFTHVSFWSNDVVLCLLQGSVFMWINGNFVMHDGWLVGCSNDERCLIHNLRVEKHWRFRNNYKNIFTNKWAHLNCDSFTANARIVQIV